MSTIQWYAYNIKLLKHMLRRRVEFDEEEATWVKIFDFPLPENFKYRNTDLLLAFEGVASSITAFPKGFYLNQGLETHRGGTPHHVFESGTYYGVKDLSHLGYAWFCLRLQSWKPSWDVVSGDNMLTICNTIYKHLSEVK